jgi:GTP-binding protein
MQFVDECRILLKAGKGGDGVVSWRHEKHVAEGGPDGGDGGKGGDIYVIGDYNDNSLFNIRNKKLISAEDGVNGGADKLFGKGGKDEYVHVPVGTTIYDSTGNKVIIDILQNGQVYLLCKGGKGGHGNAFFKSSKNRIPALYERGDYGQVCEVIMKIRFCADIGIIGLPNAGKSTLISNISNAKTKIGNYQFTTLTPVLGTVNYKNKSLIFEDVPGLIEGASEGKGLGFDFLKHIERCYVLIHLISLSSFDNPDIVASYKTITKELVKYHDIFKNKPIIIVGNKTDSPDCENNLKKLEKFLKKKIFTISAKEKHNTKELVEKIFIDYQKTINSLKKLEIKKITKTVKVRRKNEKDILPRDIEVKKLYDNTFEIKSNYLTY